MCENEREMSARGLSQKFMDDLKLESGVLNPILQRVLEDRTLDLEIRDNYINVYYRGGSLIKIEKRNSDYLGEFNTEYMKGAPARNSAPDWSDIFPYSINKHSEACTLVHGLFPFMKEGMNRRVSGEREFQQLVVRENNYSPISNGTDYAICDIEYTHTNQRELRFDLIAAYWPSKSSARKNPDSMKLALIEMKYGDGALTDPAGIQPHYHDLKKSFPHIGILCTEMTTVTKQKAELGLIRKSKLDDNDASRIESITVSANEKPEWILLLANHNPKSSILRKELTWLENKSEKENFPFEIKISVSNFMGYGLYEDCIFPLSEFLKKFMPEKASR